MIDSQRIFQIPQILNLAFVGIFQSALVTAVLAPFARPPPPCPKL